MKPAPKAGRNDDCPDAVEVTRLIEKGNSKSAVEAAKQLHKRLGTPASESLLVDAYLARIQSMAAHHMTAEAEALLRVVRERHPGFARRLDCQRDSLVRAGGGLEELLAPLNDAATPVEVRAEIEQTLRRELTDPSGLAACRVLPAGHPLMQAAAAISQALTAVTTGPVDDTALSLPEVSRRSPLAPWKPLVRAIAYYYRRDDARCLEQLAGIDPDSAPARLIPTLTVLAGKAEASHLKPAASSLVAQTGASLGQIRQALRAIETAAREGEERLLVKAVREAALLVRQECPDMQEEFRRRVMILGLIVDAPPGQILSALGGAARQNAQFLLMRARAAESTDIPPVLVCHMWEQFRQEARKERWFPAHGPEEAILLLHMAELAGDIDPDEIDWRESESMRRALAELRGAASRTEVAFDVLDAAGLYKAAAAMDPSPEVFERWATWTEESSSPAEVESVMNAWQQALPNDVRPLLRLMQRAEERSALKKALGYLRRAEALDGVNAEVRRARLRLLIAGVVRHLKQQKPHLAAPALAELRSLPQARENHRAVFVASLGFIAAVLADRGSEALAASAEIRALLDDPLAVSFAVASVGGLCGLPMGVDQGSLKGRWIEAIPPVCAMGWDLGYSFTPPEVSKPAILQELQTADMPVLERFAATMMRLGWDDLAFAVSAAGFARGNDRDVYFLRVRARAYVVRDIGRWEDCLLAAISLAQSGGDVELARQAQEEWAEMSFGSIWGQPPPAMLFHVAQGVLHREKKLRGQKAPQRDQYQELPGFAGSLDRPPARRRLSRRGASRPGELPF